MFSITLVNKVIFWRNKIPGVNSQVLPFLVPFHFMCFVPFKTSSLQLSLPKKAFRKKKPKYFNRREMCHVGPFFKTFLRAPTAKEHDIGWHKTRCINLRYSSARSSSFHKVTFWRVSQTLYEEIKLVCMHAILVFLLLFCGYLVLHLTMQFRSSLHLGISSISRSRMRPLIFSFSALMHFSLERHEDRRAREGLLHCVLLQFVQMYFL